mmetsp:Transcript_20000/g.46724  ORF Transcript_20000/g.46724 Transcript_20000/m.46724 type:complete len:89 (+) Transcript_20000:75-341(+)
MKLSGLGAPLELQGTDDSSWNEAIADMQQELADLDTQVALGADVRGASARVSSSWRLRKAPAVPVASQAGPRPPLQPTAGPPRLVLER